MLETMSAFCSSFNALFALLIFFDAIDTKGAGSQDAKAIPIISKTIPMSIMTSNIKAAAMADTLPVSDPAATLIPPAITIVIKKTLRAQKFFFLVFFFTKNLLLKIRNKKTVVIS
jgi:hypothetical protein